MLTSSLLKTFQQVCCNVLQCVAEWSRLLQRVAVCCSHVDVGCYVDELAIIHIQNVCCSMLQCVAVCSGANSRHTAANALSLIHTHAHTHTRSHTRHDNRSWGEQ